MPEIPQAASYNQLPGGLQLGLEMSAQAEAKRRNLAEEAYRQQELAARQSYQQGELGIQQQAALRQAQEYEQGRQAQNFIGQRFAEEQAKEAARADAAMDNRDDPNAKPYQRRSASEIFTDILPEAYARYPVSTLGHVLPFMRSQILSPYQSGLLDVRETAAKTAAARAEEDARHHAETEELRKERDAAKAENDKTRTSKMPDKSQPRESGLKEIKTKDGKLLGHEYTDSDGRVHVFSEHEDAIKDALDVFGKDGGGGGGKKPTDPQKATLRYNLKTGQMDDIK